MGDFIRRQRELLSMRRPADLVGISTRACAAAALAIQSTFVVPAAFSLSSTTRSVAEPCRR
jgi:hypothetical protein